jgi:hypothetical protein
LKEVLFENELRTSQYGNVIYKYIRGDTILLRVSKERGLGINDSSYSEHLK